MSYAAERWARSQKVGNASAKFVLIELANALNRESGKCFPSIDALQKATELNRKTVIAATKFLEERGFITKQRSFANGKQTIYYGFPSFNSADWDAKKSTESGTLESTENGTLLDESTRIGTLESTEIGTTESTKTGTHDSTENGTFESTVFGPVTGNKNREIEQGIACPRKRRGKPTILPTTVKRSKSRRQQEPSQRQAAHSRLTTLSRLNTLSTHKQSIQASTLRRSSPSSSTSTSRRTTSSAIGWPHGGRGRRKQRSSLRAGRRASRTHHAITSRSSLMKPTTETGVFDGIEGNVFSTG